MWQIKIKARAEKEIGSLPNKTLQKVNTVIKALKENPFTEKTIKLKVGQGYRIRIGDYRILYEIDREDKIITIYALRHRSNAYK